MPQNSDRQAKSGRRLRQIRRAAYWRARNECFDSHPKLYWVAARREVEQRRAIESGSSPRAFRPGRNRHSVREFMALLRHACQELVQRHR